MEIGKVEVHKRTQHIGLAYHLTDFRSRSIGHELLRLDHVVGNEKYMIELAPLEGGGIFIGGVIIPAPDVEVRAEVVDRHSGIKKDFVTAERCQAAVVGHGGVSFRNQRAELRCGGGNYFTHRLYVEETVAAGEREGKPGEEREKYIAKFHVSSEFNLEIECITLRYRLGEWIAHGLGIEEVLVVGAEHKQVAGFKSHTHGREAPAGYDGCGNIVA